MSGRDDLGQTFLRTFGLLFAGFLVLFLADMLNRHGFARHSALPGRMMLYLQPPVYAFLWSVLVFSLGRFAKVVLRVVVGWLCLFELADLFTRLFLGLHICADLFMILFGSSPEELEVFLRNYAGWKAVLFLLFWGVCLIPFWFVSARFSFPRGWRALRGVVVAVSGLTLVLLWRIESFNALMYSAVIVRTGEDIRVIADQKEISEHPQVSSTFSIGSDCSPIGVFVIGESATRNHMGVYGYLRDTTPGLCRRSQELFWFQDLVGAAPGTQPGVRFLLTLATVEAPKKGRMALPWALAQAGYGVDLVSSQTKWGGRENVTSMLFRPCRSRVYLNEKINGRYYDDALLPYVDDFVKRSGKGRGDFLFLHLSGNHFPWHEACPDDQRRYASDFRDEITEHVSDAVRTSVNDYDSSVVFTDSVLSRIIDMLERVGRPAFMIYVPDHGETPDSGSMRRMTDRNLWELPFVVWLSAEYRKQNPQLVSRLEKTQSLPIQSDQLFYGILELALVAETPRDSMRSNSFLSPEFAVKSRRMICDGTVCYEDVFVRLRSPGTEHESGNDQKQIR